MSSPLGPPSGGWPVPDEGFPPPWEPPPSTTYDDGTVPTTVMVAVVLTGLASTVTLLFVTFLGVILSEATGDIVEMFYVDNAHAWVRGIFIGLGALCVVADVLALFVLRRSQFARWALVVLCAITIAISGVLALGIFISVAHLIAAAAVLVLLVIPDSGRWFARPPA